MNLLSLTLLLLIPTTPGPLITGASAANLDLLRVETFDFAFRAPSTARSGFNRIRVVNRGPSPHHVEMTKVPDTATVAGLFKLYTGSATPVGLKDWGGPNITMKGDSSEAIVELVPGRYSITCWVTGVNKKEHVMSGMITLIDVKRAPSPPPAPKSDLFLRTADFRFTWSGPLTRGAHLVRFDNDGPQEHDIQIVKLHADGSMKKILKWANDGLVGAPPNADLAGGATGINPGNHVWFPLDLTPGRYVMYCFVPDLKDGKPHILHSMWKEFTVR